MCATIVCHSQSIKLNDSRCQTLKDAELHRRKKKSEKEIKCAVKMAANAIIYEDFEEYYSYLYGTQNDFEVLLKITRFKISIQTLKILLLIFSSIKS